MRPMIRRPVVCALLLGFLSSLPGDPRAMASASPNAFKPVHALFGLAAPDAGPFPSDWFTVRDRTHNTGRRIDLPLPDCKERVSDCEDLEVINTLDGFNLQPRLSIPFDGPIDLNTVTSNTVFLIRLGGSTRRHDSNHNDDEKERSEDDGVDDERHGLRVIGIDQVVWDVPTNTLHVESDDLLDQHTGYALLVTRGVHDASGNSIAATEAFRRFRRTVRGEYKQALLGAIHAARRFGIRESDIATASVFTTQSVTAVLEKIRDQIKAATPKPANFQLGPAGERTVFPLNQVTEIAWTQQTGDNPPPYTTVPKGMNLQLLGRIPGAVDRVAFGRYSSPDYETHSIEKHPGEFTPGEFMPPVGTLTGIPLVQGTSEIYFNLFIPSGIRPPGGWPVALHGTGADGSKQRDLWVVATLAEQGIATMIINAMGRGFGPLGTLTVGQMGGPPVTFPAGGRGIDQNRDKLIGNQEGQNATGSKAIIANRDAQRQTVVDYLQLVRVIEVGIDVDGDGSTDLDRSRISYFGWSFGANHGTTFLALEPSVMTGALYCLGGPVFENNRLSPASRSAGLGTALANRTPSLLKLNIPGITTLDGTLVAQPTSPVRFNENMPLRNNERLIVELVDGTLSEIRSPVTNTVLGANAIQEYLERRDWVNQSGNQVAYARHLRRAPLVGVPPKSVLILFGKGDQMVPNPSATALIRAGALADRVTFYRNDRAREENDLVPVDPHRFVNNIACELDACGTPSAPVAPAVFPLLAEIAGGAQGQIARFLLSDGTVSLLPQQAARFFEVPSETQLPESLNFPGSVR